jgi:sugar lactone lactonase YvrE
MELAMSREGRPPAHAAPGEEGASVMPGPPEELDAPGHGGPDPVAGFALTLEDLVPVGSGLRRPECVLTTASGELYVSDMQGVRLIRPDGSSQLFSGQTQQGHVLKANGFALMPNGSFLVSALFGGGVYRLGRDGQATPFLMEVDGRPLDCPNFVLQDHAGRIWIACLTQQDRKTIQVFPRHQSDGYIVLVDQGGARVVADGINYPNEIRIHPSGEYLYTNETTRGRLLRYPLATSGDLGAPEVVAEFDDSNMIDGFTLDSAGGAWLTALVSNRLWYVSPDGETKLLLENYEEEQLARLVEMQRSTGIARELLYEDHGNPLANISCVTFGGPDLRTAYMGSLMGEHLLSFRAPVAGTRPVHWDYGPFA